MNSGLRLRAGRRGLRDDGGRCSGWHAGRTQWWLVARVRCDCRWRYYGLECWRRCRARRQFRGRHGIQHRGCRLRLRRRTHGRRRRRHSHNPCRTPKHGYRRLDRQWLAALRAELGLGRIGRLAGRAHPHGQCTTTGSTELSTLLDHDTTLGAVHVPRSTGAARTGQVCRSS